MKNKEVTILSNSKNQPNLTNSLNNQILSNDECNCRYCSARLIIKIGNFLIPLSEQDFLELFVRESVFCSITKNMFIYPYNKKIFKI